MKSKKKKVYIAGKMRGIKFYNFPLFDSTKERLKKMGYRVCSPADLDRRTGYDALKLPADTDWNANPSHFSLINCMIRDINHLLKCDIMVILPTPWDDSLGVNGEIGMARWAGIPILDSETMKPIAFYERCRFKELALAINAYKKAKKL